MRLRKTARVKKSPRQKKPLLAKRLTRARTGTHKLTTTPKMKKRAVAPVAAGIPAAAVAQTVALAPTVAVMPSSQMSSPTRSNGAWAFVLVMVCLSAAAMLSAAFRSGEIAEGPGAAAPSSDVVADYVGPQPAKNETPAPRPKDSSRPADLAKRADTASTVKPAVSEPVVVERAPFERAPLEPAARVFAEPAAASTTVVSVASQAPSVTITGCLELDDETFRLRNTSGDSAPKARSWKSGFLRKSSATIEVVDAVKNLALPNHVGRRVAVTGTLVDREMKARTLQTIAPSCDQTA